MKQNKEKGTKSTLKKLRNIRDKVNLEIKDMTSEELKAYFRKKGKIHPDKYEEYKQTEHNN